MLNFPNDPYGMDIEIRQKFTKFFSVKARRTRIIKKNLDFDFSTSFKLYSEGLKSNNRSSKFPF